MINEKSNTDTLSGSFALSIAFWIRKYTKV